MAKDWGGHSPPVSNKKHIPQQPTKIAALPVGLCADEEAWKPGRKPGNLGEESSSESLIGGPVPENNPSVVEPSSWQTEAQAASIQELTSRDQLTESGRSRIVRGKHSTVPAYEKAKPFDETVGARLRLENPYSLNDKNRSVANENEENCQPNNSLIGYRSGGGSRSFLEGLASELVATTTFTKT